MKKKECLVNVTLAENAYVSRLSRIIDEVATLNAEKRIIVVSLIVAASSYAIWHVFEGRM
jgi:hypothetical protein